MWVSLVKVRMTFMWRTYPIRRFSFNLVIVTINWIYFQMRYAGYLQDMRCIFSIINSLLRLIFFYSVLSLLLSFDQYCGIVVEVIILKIAKKFFQNAFFLCLDSRKNRFRPHSSDILQLRAARYFRKNAIVHKNP